MRGRRLERRLLKSFGRLAVPFPETDPHVVILRPPQKGRTLVAVPAAEGSPAS